MTRKVITVALNGVTGRMGYRQHLVRSLLAIREQGGVRLEDGSCLYPEPILVGRNEERLRAIAERHGLERWTTRLDEVLADPSVDVYFDAQVTSAREVALMKAIEAGKHVYTEKPVAGTLDGALRLARAAKAAGITHGVVHDKLFLPGVMKLQRLLGSDFFGRVLSVRLEFGYWVCSARSARCTRGPRRTSPGAGTSPARRTTRPRTTPRTRCSSSPAGRSPR
jgi:predicted dehydrogenase